MLSFVYILKITFQQICNKFTLGALAFFSLAFPSFSEPSRFLNQIEARGLITTVKIDMSDQVSDGCWTNASAIEAKLRLLFEQNGIIVKLEDLAFLTVPGRSVYVSVLGYRNGGTCVAHAQFSVVHWVNSSIGGSNGLPKFTVSGSVVSFEKNSIFTNGANVNQQIQEFVEEAASTFVADILSARRSESVRLFKNTYPNFGQNLATEIEWKKYLSTLSKED